MSTDQSPSETPPPPPGDKAAWARPGLGVIPEPIAEQHLESLTQLALRTDVTRAQLLCKVDQSRHYRLRGCANITEYGARLGLRECVTRDLVRTGYVLLRMPEIEGMLLEGKVSFRSAGELFRVLSEPGAATEPWLTEARARSTRDFCALVEEHLAAGRFASQPVRISLVISEHGLRHFKRAHTLIQRRVGRVLSEGESLEVLASDFVKEHDPLAIPDDVPPTTSPERKSEPPSESPPGSTQDHEDPSKADPDAENCNDVAPNEGDPPGGAGMTGKGDTTGDVRDSGTVCDSRRGRYIKRAVRRAVRKRHRDRCAVPCCPNRAWIDFAHLVPHRDGGDTSEKNLIQLCWTHNQMMEVGFLAVKGPVDALRFFDARGTEYKPHGRLH